MLNFVYDHTLEHRDGQPVLIKVTEDYSRDAINRNDIQCMEHAEAIAADATVLTGRRHIAVDAGASTSPRYDVIEAPVIGNQVSRRFNGDSYPAGTIVSVSPTFKTVITDDGTTFYRQRQSASWRANGTWFIVARVA